MAKTKNIQKSEVADLKQTIRSLKQQVSFFKKKCKRLASEIRTLEKGFKSSVDYIDEQLDWLEVEEVIKHVDSGKKLPEITAGRSIDELPDNEYDALTKEEAVRRKFLELIGR